MSTKTSRETLGFQTEVRQLLKLMIHSLYSNKEIFLRELISNASDAADKLRFEALAEPDLLADDPDLAIRIETDSDNATLTISDNGIGMSREELVANLGTIARSGTAEFLQQMTGDEQKDARLIGQFGVGFYSAFIVADKVVVESRRAGLKTGEAVRWESDGAGEFTVEPIEREQRGTSVTLHLKTAEKEFAEPLRIESLIRKYSDHIAFPVTLVSADDADGKLVNEATALWTRPRSDIDDDEYKEFYKHLSHDFADPLTWSHNRVEGKREYTSLLYIPANAPFDLWNLTRRVLDMLAKLASESAEDYAGFWREFGQVLKEGAVEDHANKDKIAGLLRFATTHTGTADQDQSLDDYVGRMAEGQDKIYYVLAENYPTAASSPHIEQLTGQGIEVLLLTDRIDPWLVDGLREYDGKKLVDVARERLELPAGDNQMTQETLDDEHKPLLKKIRKVLKDRVETVHASTRLVSSPACVVAGQDELNPQLRRMLEASGQRLPESKPILEVNVAHPLLERLSAETDNDRFTALTHIVLDHALLAEGSQLDDPAAYVQRMNALLLELDSAAGSG